MNNWLHLLHFIPKKGERQHHPNVVEEGSTTQKEQRVKAPPPRSKRRRKQHHPKGEGEGSTSQKKEEGTATPPQRSGYARAFRSSFFPMVVQKSTARTSSNIGADMSTFAARIFFFR